MLQMASTGKSWIARQLRNYGYWRHVSKRRHRISSGLVPKTSLCKLFQTLGIRIPQAR